MNPDFFRSFHLWYNRETIQDVIFEAELMVASSEIDVAIVINKYASKLETEKPFAADELKSIARRLKANQSKLKVYADYMDKEIVNLLSTAEGKGLSTGPILEEYAPIRKIAVRNSKMIKAALTLPFFLFVFITIVLSVILQKLTAAENSIEFSPVSHFIMHNFIAINSVVLVGLIGAFFYIPHKLPILSKVYTKLNALLAISLASTMFDIGVSAKDVIPIIRKQFDIVPTKGKGDIAELTAILGEKKFLTPNEMADLELAMEYGNFEKMLANKKEKKFEEATRFSELVGEIVKNFSLIVMATPIFQFVVIILDLVAKSTSRVSL